MDPQVTEVVPGELDVVLADGARCRVLLPAGVGIAGVPDTDLAGALVEVLASRGRPVPAVVDASRLFVDDPRLVAALERELEIDT